MTQGSPCHKAIEILSRVNGSWKAGGRALGEREPALAGAEGAGTARLPGLGFLGVIPPRGAGSVPGGAAGLVVWAEGLGSCVWEQPQLCRGCFVAGSCVLCLCPGRLLGWGN